MKLTPSESDIQIAICDYLRLIAPRHGLVFFAVPNEAIVPKSGNRLSGGQYGRIKRLTAMGMTSGVSDLVLTHAGKSYFVEVKKPGGRQSETQKDFMKSVLASGAEYAVVRSVDDVIRALEVWGIIK